MAHSDWFARLGSAIILLTPLYLIMQVWFASAWEGRWRWVALVPVLGLLAAMVFAFIALSQGGNQWPLVLVFFSPLGFFYLLIAALVRAAVRRKAA